MRFVGLVLVLACCVSLYAQDSQKPNATRQNLDSTSTKGTKNDKSNKSALDFWAGIGDFPPHLRELLATLLDKNEQIKLLNAEMLALQAQAKKEAKWENPMLSFGYNSAHITQPFQFGVNDMQNIAIGISQKLDLSAKRAAIARATRTNADIKILEIKALQNALIASMIGDIIRNETNLKTLELLDKSLQNLNFQINSLGSSKNFNSLQIQKLSALKAKLQIRRNQIANALRTLHISASQASFGAIDLDSASARDFSTQKNISQNTPESSAHQHTYIAPSAPNTTQNTDIRALANALIEKASKEAKALDSARFEALLREIESSNYEINQTLLAQKAAHHTTSAARREYLSDIEVGFSYMIRANRTDMFGVSVGVPLPLYGKQIAQAKESKLKELGAQISVREAQNKIKHSASAIFAQITTLRENLALIDKVLLPANTKSIELYTHHATSQSGAFLEFYTALNERIDSEILRLETLSDLCAAYWNLQALRGDN